MAHVPSGNLAKLRTLLDTYLGISELNSVIQFKSGLSWTANGTFSVSITALAPAGVTTATVGKWLTLEDNAGTLYYVPAWT